MPAPVYNNYDFGTLETLVTRAPETPTPYDTNIYAFIDYLGNRGFNLSIKKEAKSTTKFCSICEGTANITIVNGRKVCENCVKQYYKTCSGVCKRLLIEQNYRRSLDPSYYEYRTAFHENWRNMLDRREDPFKVKWFCSDCLNDKEVNKYLSTAWSCSNCGASYCEITHGFTSAAGSFRCKVCHHEKLLAANKELAYNANILDYLEAFKPPSSNLQFGIELEVQIPRGRESINSKIPGIRALFPEFAICKHDGSLLLRDEWVGFEIVSVPATVEQHKHYWPRLFESKHGLVSWKTGDCGMHVHISRKALTSLQIGKIVYFVNSPDNGALINRVAGRYSSKYTTILDKKITDVNARPTGDHNYDRRQAVNLLNTNTVEIRIFRGNLKPESFFKNLEFTEALVLFCKLASISKLNSDEFIKYVDNNRSAYPYLTRFFIKHKLLTMVQRISMKEMPIHTESLARRREALEKENAYIYDEL